MPAETATAAADVVKLRMKVGAHEFEAEGPRDLVMLQLGIWKQLANLGTPGGDMPSAGEDPALRRLFAVDTEKKTITLRAGLGGQRRNADAVLLLLYGYHAWFPSGDAGDVPATTVKAAFAASGYRHQRIDRAIARYLAAGMVRKAGSHKHETYALTLSGQQHAAALARQLAGAR